VLTKIDVMSDNGFELPIVGVTPKDSLLLKKVTGLNPPDRNLFIGDYSQDGGLYQGRRVGNRNVVFTIDLNPNPALGETVATLRDSLYRAFIDPQPEGDHLKILLHDDQDREMYLVGYCEKFEGEVFDVETMCQISMICPDPYLRDNVDTILTNPTGYIQFPFTYQGSAETGFVVRIYVTAPTDTIILYNNNKTLKLYNSSGFEVDDVIIVNTIRGQRSITITKDAVLTTAPVEFDPPTGYIQGSFVFYGPGIWKALTDNMSGGTDYTMAPGLNDNDWELVSTPIVTYLDPMSVWLELHASENVMRVYGPGGWDDIVANIKYLKYTSAYWGV